MKLRYYLISMTLLAVMSDSMLHPFFPQFFERSFGITDPRHIGFYIAATCLTIMFSFPFWAMISRWVPELKLLVYTQLAAGILSLYCFWTSSLTGFWVVSLTMIGFKGSYLLIYPYIMRLVDKNHHHSTIGLLSVVVHFGCILGALFGGAVMDSFAPKTIYLVIAAGDFIQMAVSAYLLLSPKFDTQISAPDESVKRNKTLVPSDFVLKIGSITLLLYFSIYLIRPFFSVYWEHISKLDSPIISGAMYAIPGLVALLALWLDSKSKNSQNIHQAILPALLICVCGLMLQAAPYMSVIFIGRMIYGWGIYHVVVKFDVLLFRLSSPTAYASDYSKVHFFQNLGVLIASFSAGFLVDAFGLQIPFYLATIGFAITLALYLISFRIQEPIRFFFTKKLTKKQQS